VFVYVGTYTEPPSGRAEGIYVLRFDTGSGSLTPVRTVTGVPNPSFLALGADRQHLYAVNELTEGGVSAFARDPRTGELRALNRQLSHGADPCYVGLDTSGRFVLVANYSGGTVSALPIAAGGTLDPASSVIRHEGSSVDPTRQTRPHAHMIGSTPDGRYVLATDLGADRIVVYQLDTATGRLVPNASGPPFAAAEPGAGPRHFAFAPNGRTVYVINELASTLTVYAYDGERGELRSRQTVSSLPVGFAGENSCAHVVVSPDGRFVYGSNRGHDSIAIWATDETSGEVTPAGHESTRGKTPRGFALDPTGAWLLAANQDSDTIVTFRRDPGSGNLTATGQVTEIPSPVAVLFAQD
jgi:6-phosphogluconolactonase